MGKRCDLLLVVPDDNIRIGLTTFLRRRTTALGMADIKVETFVIVDRDSGCYRMSPDIVRERRGTFEKALILFDYEGCGQEAAKAPSEVEADVRQRLELAGCHDCADVLLFVPEFEILVWSASPHVDQSLGWMNKDIPLRKWLEAQGLSVPGAPKPVRPKEALEAVLRETKRPQSSALYGKLAERVSTRGCQDTSFHRLVEILTAWFPT